MPVRHLFRALARPLPITAFTVTSALGAGLAATLVALERGVSALRRNDFESSGLDTWIGRVEGLEGRTLPSALQRYDCRNNRLALMALEQDGFQQAAQDAIRRHGAERVAVVLGTSTSGIRELELAYARRMGGPLPAAPYLYRCAQNPFSLSAIVREHLGARGPAHTVSTACSSSAKVFASAYRMLAAGLCDAAVVGGADSLCFMTLFGFNSLKLLSQDPCRPWSPDRDGLSVGEAAGFALLERDGAAGLTLEGYGESSDAYHMSAPHPEGAGADAAMRAALRHANCDAETVEYINLHGTGSPANDRAEDLAVCAVFGTHTLCSATKGLTGHALGAAGILESVICLLALRHGLVPGTANTRARDPRLSVNLLVEPQRGRLRRALTNSFGFGGNNCSLLFGRA